LKMSKDPRGEGDRKRGTGETWENIRPRENALPPANKQCTRRNGGERPGNDFCGIPEKEEKKGPASKSSGGEQDESTKGACVTFFLAH